MANVAFLTERMRLGFGVDLVVDQVAAGLAGRGHDVTVYASYEDGTYHGRPYTLERFSVPAIKYAPLYDIEAARRAKRFGLAARGHEVFLAETQPFFALLPWLARRATAIAVDHGVVDARGFPLTVKANFAFAETAQQRVYFRPVHHIVTVSEFLKHDLPVGLQAKTTAIHNGADHYALASDVDVKAMRARLGIAEDEVMLLYLGRLNPHHQPYKGTEELLNTYAALSRAGEIPRARLVMAGFGADTDADWVRSGGAIPFTNVPVPDMPALLGAADLFVTASKWEGFNLNLVEAQRAGAAAIAYRRGAHPEVVRDGETGLLVKSNRGLADAIRDLVRDDGRRRQMAANAREWASTFTWARAVDEYERVIADAITARGGRGGS
jgi:glycosyltransferase involved in cell wall biosynthesis